MQWFLDLKVARIIKLQYHFGVWYHTNISFCQKILKIYNTKTKLSYTVITMKKDFNAQGILEREQYKNKEYFLKIWKLSLVSQ